MNQIEIYAAIATVVISVLSGITISAMNAGRIENRIANLESQMKESVGRPEWNMFLQELRDRLARIEAKLDKLDTK